LDQRDLVRRASGGDPDAFAQLVAASIGRLEAVARLVLRDPELARDAVQDTYVRAWRDLRGLRDPDRLDAWLHRLTINSCMDVARRLRRSPIELKLTPLMPTAVVDHAGLVADRDELERAFRHLSPEQRAVLVLHYYVGLTVAGVAETLGIPLGTAQSRLGRALVALREALHADRATTPTTLEGRAVG